MTFDEMAATGTIQISASPEHVYGLIAQLAPIGDWSPECKEVKRSGDANALAVGEKFHGTNRIGDFEWTTECEITVAEPGVKLSWNVDGGAGDGHAANWTYELAPADGGTSVTESFKIGPSRGGYRRFGKGKTDEEQAAMAASRVEQLTAAIATTLENLKAAAES